MIFGVFCDGTVDSAEIEMLHSSLIAMHLDMTYSKAKKSRTMLIILWKS